MTLSRRLAAMLAMVLVVSTLSACSAPKNSAQDTMVIEPSEFSDETNEVLELLDEEISFFAFAVDETVKSASINAWVYENGEWVDKGATSGNIDRANNQIAVQVTENGYNIFSLDESGHTKYAAPEAKIDFEKTTQQISHKLSNPKQIVIGEEIPLWVKIGSDENEAPVLTDFRNAKCTAGFAFTVTFSSDIIK